MDFNPALLISGVVILLCGGLVYLLGQAHRKLATLIETMQVTPVASVTPGFVEVKGRAKGARPLLVSPLTAKPCVYFRFLVEEQVKRGKSTYWRTVVDDQQECGLVLEDMHQGSIAVNLRNAQLMLNPDVHLRSGFLNDAPAGVEAALQRYGQSSQGLIFNKSMRYAETVLEVNDEIHVLGLAQLQDGKMVIDRGGEVFIVSDQPEEVLTRSLHRKQTVRSVIAALIGLVGAGLCWLSVMVGRV